MLAYRFVTSIALLSKIVLGQTDTTLDNPSSVMVRNTFNLSDCSGRVCPPRELTMNGHHNYNAAQQIFYVYGPLQWRRMADGGEVGNSMRDDYIVTDVGAHKLHLRRVKWNQARKICIEEGGHLAIINSQKEEKALLNMMGDRRDCTWLGVHDLYEEGDWTTVLDQALETTGYSKWTTAYANQPDNYGGEQNCGCLMKQEGMDDASCSTSRPFFCELPSASL